MGFIEELNKGREITMKMNNKGMTLIEITVTLVISSIVLFIAGSIILNSFGYFNKTEVADKDKMAVDNIAELVRDELVYAADVRIEKPANKPSDPSNVSESEKWHWISIDEKGHLNKDDKSLFSDDFYHNRKLKLTVKLYANDYRMDIGFSFLDGEKEEVYKTMATLEIINMKSSLSSETTTHVSTEITNNTEDDYRIYYRMGANNFINKDPGQDDSTITGTVADEESICRKAENTVSWANGKNDYPTGSFVRYPDNETGIWYRATENIENSSKPDENPQGVWKAMTTYWVSTSTYQKGDVVEATKGISQYYQCIQSHKYNKNPQTNPKFWKLLTKDEFEKIKKEHESDDFCTINDNVNDKTVGGEAKRCTSIDNPIIEWKVGVVVKRGEYVSYGGKVYRYINAGPITADGNYNPSDADITNWKQIETEWNQSVYGIYDIVSYNDKYYQLKWPDYFQGGNPPPENTENWSLGFDTPEELIESTKKYPTCDVKP